MKLTMKSGGGEISNLVARDTKMFGDACLGAGRETFRASHFFGCPNGPFKKA